MTEPEPREGRGRWVLGAVVSLTALALAVWGVQPTRLAETLRAARLGFLPLILLLQLTGIAARARAWQTLLGEVPYRRAFAALNEGYLLNSLLPVRLGELVRAYLVQKGAAFGTAQALGSVVVERVLDVTIALGALVLTLPALAAPAWAREMATAVGVALAVVVIGLGALVLSRRSGPALMARLPGVLGRVLPRLVQGLTSGVHAAGSFPRLLPGAAWLLAGWVAAWAQFELYLRTYGATGSPNVWLFALSVIAFGAAVPSSPGAIGVFELAGSAGLRALGYPAEVALSVAVTAHLMQIAVTGILGSWFLSREGESVAHLAREATDLARRVAQPRSG
ncbi:MAG TPA: lysylphosphatidylglycerol synthase transmembrane domain-containing protein [Anaerolineales bacterium]|nr:lysylphosphatidylglycerol synthase transmembrane domain-containing protein [Anaerolineales bacterium]